MQSEVWAGPLRVEPRSDLCTDGHNYTQNEYERRICFTLLQSVINGFDNVTFQVAAFNAGSSVNGEWSAPVFPVISDEPSVINVGILVVIIIVAIAAFIIVILAVTLTVNKCTQRRKARNRYLNVPVYAPSSSANNGPIILNNGDNRQTLPPPWTPPLRNRNSSNNSRYSHLLLPVNNGRGSIQETPLPPLPLKMPADPVYEELSQDTLLKRQALTSVRVSFNAVNEEGLNNDSEDEDFLKPTNTSTDDEDGYLKPKTASDVNNDGDDEEYLKPTFNQFTRINSRDLSPPHETPPPIPIQSYSPVRKQSS